MNKKGERERRVPIHPTTPERRDRDGLEPRSASHTTNVASWRRVVPGAHALATRVDPPQEQSLDVVKKILI